MIKKFGHKSFYSAHNGISNYLIPYYCKNLKEINQKINDFLQEGNIPHDTSNRPDRNHNNANIVQNHWSEFKKFINT